MSFLPPNSPEVSTLLSILADPVKSKAKLEELAKAHQALAAATTELKVRQAAEEQRQKELQAGIEKHTALKSENEDSLAKLIAQYKSKVEALDQSERDFNKTKEGFSATSSAKELELKKWEARLTDLDKTLTALDAHLRESQLRSVEVRKELDEKLKKVKQLLS